MAIKPPPIGDVFRQVNELLGNSGLKGEVDKSVRGLVQSALGRMDMVSRDEFDAQAEILARTRARVEELEKELDALNEL
jgi:BMFP domain-containing protein YqiC